MGDEPRRLVGHAERAVELVGRNAILACFLPSTFAIDAWAGALKNRFRPTFAKYTIRNNFPSLPHARSIYPSTYAVGST